MAFVALALALRLGARLYSGADDFWATGYTFFFSMAQNIAAGNGIGLAGGAPTAFRVPLYPLLLAGLTMGHTLFWSVVTAQGLIGAGTTWCAALLAREMFGGAAPVYAAAAVAVYPYYVIHDTAFQETSLFTLLTLLSVLVLRRATAVSGLGDHGCRRRSAAGPGRTDARDDRAVRGACANLVGMANFPEAPRPNCRMTWRR